MGSATPAGPRVGIVRADVYATMRVARWWCIVAPLILIAVAAAFQWKNLEQSREQYKESARLNAQNLGATLAASIAGSFQDIDHTLLASADQLRLRHWPDHVDGPALEAELAQLRERTPSLIGLRVIDANGEMLYGADKADKVNVADRDYFTELKDRPEAGMVISKPLLSRAAGKWVVVCARRLYLPDGRFGGIISGVIGLEGMAERLSGKEIRLGDRDVFALRDNQANLIIRYVHRGQDLKAVGVRLVSPNLAALDRSGASSGFYESQSALDGVQRISYFQRIPGWPLSLVVGLSNEDAMAGWQREARHAWIETGVFGLLVAIAAGLVYRTQMRRLQAAAELVDAHAFNREIIENSALGIHVYRQDGRCVLVNPATAAIIGGTRAQLMAQNFRELSSWRDSGALDMAEQTLADGVARNLHAPITTSFGKKLWLDWVFTSFVSRGERQLLGIMRDVTEIQEAREALEESNRKLAVLSQTDGLTGLANRRSFDETLLKEWRRAARNGLPLSLAMMDVDHFKKYNDHYGHQRGDDCLKSVAQVIGRHCRRAGDVAARYGGEEFVLVSPATDGAHMQRLAETIRRELEALALPHALDPAGRVSISIGVATVMPQEGSQPEQLVAAADRALYAAKEQGRNRVVVGAV